MIPHRINVKFYIEEPNAVDLAAIAPIFHRWIRERAVAGLLIDVADYKHVYQGPGVLLVGHEGDYGLDMGNGRPGLLYSHKRAWQSDLWAERLCTVFRRALRAAQLLEREPALNGRITFRANEAELTFPDRLHTPNEPTTFDALRDDIQGVLDRLYVGADVRLEWSSRDEKRPFTMRLTAPESPNLALLLERLEPAKTFEG